MKKIFLMILILTGQVFADLLPPPQKNMSVAPSAIEEESCPQVTEKILLTHKTTLEMKLIVCGPTSEKNLTKVSEFKIYTKEKSQVKFSEPLFSAKEKNIYFIIIKNNRGLNLVETIEAGSKKEVALFKHDIVCDSHACALKNEVCILRKSEKSSIEKQLLAILGKKNKSVKKTMKRLKKAGCLT